MLIDKHSIAAFPNIPIIPENGPVERRGTASFMDIKKPLKAA